MHPRRRPQNRPTEALCEQILEAWPHPEQGYRASLGIVRLAGPYGVERIEAAAERAIKIGAKTYLACLRHRPEGLPRQSLRRLSPLAEAPRRPAARTATDGIRAC